MKQALCLTLIVLFVSSFAFGQEPAPKKTDSTFVTDSDVNLDVSRSAGQTITFAIKIDRVVGETDGDGKLLDANVQQLIDNQVIEEYVKLKISAFDIDRDYAENPECTPRQFDRIKVNGQNIGTNGAEVFLNGTDRQWRIITYQVPVRLIRFGKWMCEGQGSNCNWQGEGENQIQIEVSTAAPQPFPCTDTLTVNWTAKVDWGAISFKALYPVFLIHGYSSDGNFWSRPEHNFAQTLKDKKMLYDNSISFPNRGKNDVFSDAYDMKNKIQDAIENKYHVKHIHIVAHSKGGLVSRDYLGTFILPNFAVASLTTLSTMHKGTAQADYSLDLREIGVGGAFRTGDTLGEDIKLVIARYFAREDAATANMRVKHVRDVFNPRNEPKLPAKMKAYDREVTVKYHSYGADANSDDSVDPNGGEPTISDQEAAHSPFVDKAIIGPLFGRRAAEEAYRFLWKYAETRVEYEIKDGKQVPVRLFRVDDGFRNLNDFLVTTLSSVFASPAHITSRHEGDIKANHPMIAKPSTATAVIDVIKSANPNPN